jgi:hypothetical protein
VLEIWARLWSLRATTTASGFVTLSDSRIRRVAHLMHEAYGLRATEEALSRAIEHRSEGDEIGFDVWSSVAVAIVQTPSP